MFKKINKFIFTVIFFTAGLVNAENWPVPADAVVQRLRLTDRFYVVSVFTDIFGPKSKSVVDEYVFMQPNTFGGPCDFYEQVRISTERYGYADPDSRCPGGKHAANVTMFGTANLLRQGFVSRVCEDLSVKPETLKFALKKIFSAKPPQVPDNQNLLTAFQLFNPERTPSNEVIEALKNIGPNEKNLQKRWSSIILVLCVDPSWQVI